MGPYKAYICQKICQTNPKKRISRYHSRWFPQVLVEPWRILDIFFAGCGNSCRFMLNIMMLYDLIEFVKCDITYS